MKRKNGNAYMVRGSGMSSFSIIGFLCFFLIIPLALVLFSLLDCSPYINGEVGAFGLTASLIDSGTLTIEVLETVSLACYVLAAIIALITLIVIIVKVYIARQKTYTFQENVLIVKKATFFTDYEETRKIFYSPGMSIAVDQTFKGWFFNYGDVVISMGLGNAGEIVMRNIKRPRKARKMLTKKIAKMSYMGYPHSSNIPNMCNSPYAYGFGLPYPFGGFGCYQPYSFFGGNCENNNCMMQNMLSPVSSAPQN